MSVYYVNEIMVGNRVICDKHNVDYVSIRKAMCNGARTKAQIEEMTGACLTCEGCKKELDSILKSVCSCKHVSLKDVVNAVNAGASTVSEVRKITGVGTECGRCVALVQNIIELGY